MGSVHPSAIPLNAFLIEGRVNVTGIARFCRLKIVNVSLNA